MLKTIGCGHGAKGGAIREAGGAPSGKTGSVRDLDDYLAFGPKAERRRRLREARRAPGSAAGVDAYLGRGRGESPRALAFWASDELGGPLGCPEHGWSRRMDATRRAWGKDSGRTYYHFVLSPDPEDHVSAEECRDVAAEWVERCFPGAEAVVSVHADNASGIMHAHIVVNAVYPEDGRKVWRSDRQVRREADAEIEILEAHGLRALPHLKDVRAAVERGERAVTTRQWSQVGPAERAIVARGGRSWVADIRHAVDECVDASGSWPEFVAAMRSRGYEVSVGRRGVVYRHPLAGSMHMMRKRGDEMGADYSEAGVRARLGVRHDAVLGAGPRTLAERVEALRTRCEEAESAQDVLRRHGVKAAARPRGQVTFEEWLAGKASRRRTRESVAGFEQALRALSTIRREGIGSRAELSRAVSEALLAARAADEAAGEVEDGAAQALEMVARAEAAERARAEIAGLPNGPWSRETRMRRNELAATIDDGEAFCRGGLAKASSWLAANGLAGASQLEQSRALAEEYGRRADALQADVEAQVARLESLVEARLVVEGGHHAQKAPVPERPVELRGAAATMMAEPFAPGAPKVATTPGMPPEERPPVEGLSYGPSPHEERRATARAVRSSEVVEAAMSTRTGDMPARTQERNLR